LATKMTSSNFTSSSLVLIMQKVVEEGRYPSEF
jgi:hypothetical protein